MRIAEASSSSASASAFVPFADVLGPSADALRAASFVADVCGELRCAPVGVPLACCSGVVPGLTESLTSSAFTVRACLSSVLGRSGVGDAVRFLGLSLPAELSRRVATWEAALAVRVEFLRGALRPMPIHFSRCVAYRFDDTCREHTRHSNSGLLE